MVPGPEVGLLVPDGTAWEHALEWGRRAEAVGATRVWVADGCAPVVVLGGLFRRLRIRLGAVVRAGHCPVPVLAKRLTGLDVIAGGRLDVAVEDTGADPPGPGADDTLAVLGAMADGSPFRSDGPIPADGARCLPPSLQRPSFPLWKAAPTSAAGPTSAPGPIAIPDGWADAGLGVISVTRWAPGSRR